MKTDCIAPSLMPADRRPVQLYGRNVMAPCAQYQEVSIMKRVIMTIALLSALGALFFGLAPLAAYRIFHLGVLLLLLYGVGVILLLVFWDGFPDMMFPGYPKEQVLWWRILRGVAAAGLCLSVVVGGLLSWRIFQAGRLNPPPQDAEPATVVVLGCLVREDGPSLMLRYRLDAALEYLREHPQAPVVVSGGQGSREPVSEAQAMAEYLMANGIAGDRIYQENQSTDTQQNIILSGEIIRREGLPERLVIATDAYHQLRVQIYAGTQGFREVYAQSGESPWGLVPSYGVREMLAIGEAVFLNGGTL